MQIRFLLLHNKTSPNLPASINKHYFTIFVGQGFGSVSLGLSWGCIQALWGGGGAAVSGARLALVEPLLSWPCGCWLEGLVLHYVGLSIESLTKWLPQSNEREREREIILGVTYNRFCWVVLVTVVSVGGNCPSMQIPGSESFGDQPDGWLLHYSNCSTHIWSAASWFLCLGHCDDKNLRCEELVGIHGTECPQWVGSLPHTYCVTSCPFILLEVQDMHLQMVNILC